MDYKDKYLKYKKKYLVLKYRVGGSHHFDEKEIEEAIRLSLQSNVKQPTPEAEAEAAGEKKEDDSHTASGSDDFDSYPTILSRLGDTDFRAGSARGDGYCSIWSVIIGRSLISEQLFHPLILSSLGKSQPTTIQEVIGIIIDIATNTKNFISGTEDFQLTDSLFVNKFELEYLITQLKKPFESLSNIEGVAHIKILAYLMNCNIIMKDITSNNIYSFNESGSTKIRISTNLKHYYTHNVNTTKEVGLVTDYWWNHMWTWTKYTPLEGTDFRMIPFIK